MDFWNELAELVTRVKQSSRVVVLGDLNARVGAEKWRMWWVSMECMGEMRVVTV